MKIIINTETKEVEILSSVSIADFLKFIETYSFLKEYKIKFSTETPKTVETVKDSKETNKESEDFIKKLIEQAKEKERKEPFIPYPWDDIRSPFVPNPFDTHKSPTAPPYKPFWIVDFRKYRDLPISPYGGFEITCKCK